MDIVMPALDGLGAMRRILERQPDARIVLFSLSGEGRGLTRPVGVRGEAVICALRPVLLRRHVGT